MKSYCLNADVYNNWSMMKQNNPESPNSMPSISPVAFQADFEKPLEVLFHCHQNIAATLEEIVRATQDLRKFEPDRFKQIFSRMDLALTHLATSGAKHTRDEEESLFPRIFSKRDDVVSEVYDVMTELEDQHKRAASIETAMGKMLANLETAENVDQNRIDLFSDLVESLYSLYRPHIQVENEFVFPVAAKILSTDELFEVGKEMYGRRRPTIRSADQAK